MKRLGKCQWLVVLFCIVSGSLMAQDSVSRVDQWYLLDPDQDRVLGVSVERAYAEFLANRPSRTVLVAVIDSGVDVDHEDLKEVIWTNPGEFAGNGIDDDKNGYVDDVHGWNFIGGKERNVDADTYELTREYVRLEKKYNTEKKISRKSRQEYEYWKKIEDRYHRYKEKNEKDLKECDEQLSIYKSFNESLIKSIATVRSAYGIETITRETIDTITSESRDLQFAKYIIGVIFQNATGDESLDEIAAELEYVIKHNGEVCEHYRVAMEYGYNPEFDSRLAVGDNYNDLSEKKYGNNDVVGPDPSHGTHVSGIIAASRNNQLGIKGIADNVRIMVIRAVPNGDERDKDIANAIFYAVDNGAKIINMSFGKDYSPQKEAVDMAVRYAESKGVLLVHAAGNDHTNNDLEPNYPSRLYRDGKVATNWIEVGASANEAGQGFVGSFSNYGKKSVDVFAPGVEIYSTMPGSVYDNQNGTSMASPVTAGVAALLMSYFPDLSATDVKDILLQSTRTFEGLKVNRPGAKESVPLSQLSITGGLVNAHEAVKLALQRTAKSLE
jgi:subtilisin family serine protease